MESMFDQAAKTVETQLTKMRWALGLNGLLLVALGVVILALARHQRLRAHDRLWRVRDSRPASSRFASAFSSDAAGERGWLVFYGLLGIAVGVMVLRLDRHLGAGAPLRDRRVRDRRAGSSLIGGAFWLPISGGDTALMILSGCRLDRVRDRDLRQARRRERS